MVDVAWVDGEAYNCNDMEEQNGKNDGQKRRYTTTRDLHGRTSPPPPEAA
jgi:hypothetical protein